MYSNGSLGSIAILDVSVLDAKTPESSDLNNVQLLEDMCKKIISECSLTIINYQIHQFEPYGVTMLFLLGESHLSIHTWPERNCFSMDVHSCASELDTNIIKNTLYKTLQVKKIDCQFIKRGI